MIVQQPTADVATLFFAFVAFVAFFAFFVFFAACFFAFFTARFFVAFAFLAFAIAAPIALADPGVHWNATLVEGAIGAEVQLIKKLSLWFSGNSRQLPDLPQV
jgi:hypothetical protein